MAGYSGNGRTIIGIYQHGGNDWRSSTYTLHTPLGIYTELSLGGVRGVLTALSVKPVIEYRNDVCGKAKTHFRGVISCMSLPEELQV